MIYLAEACRLLEWLREFGATRVHAHFGTNSTEITMLARALGGPPYSFTVHGPEEFQRPMHLDEKIARADFVVAISSFGRSQLYLHSTYAQWPKINIVHCGLEPAFYAGDASDAAPRVSQFVCVGRLCEAKGQLLLIDAFALLAEKGVDFALVLAGDGPMRAEIERRIAAHGLGAKISITGWISSGRVREEILAARALVLPSFAEGLPVVIMESLALRRPVLTTYVAGIPELVRSGENGWLFPAGSVEAIAAAVEECLATVPARLAEMGERGRDSVSRRHSIDTEAAKLAALMRAPVSGFSS
jgi:glycosyltransferase involved in cell wall biosynthesis